MRRKLVDARYLEASIPATHEPSFEVAPDARVVPVNDLPAAAGQGTRYTVLGSGKTAVDACIWLLDNGVDARSDPLGPPPGALVSPPAPLSAAGSGRRQHGAASRSTPRPPRRRLTSMTCSTGSKAAGRLVRLDPSASRDDVPEHDAQSRRDRSRSADRRRGPARPRAADRGRPDRARARARPTPAPTSSTSTARRIGLRDAPADPRLPAGAHRAPAGHGRTRRRSTRR